MGTSPQLLAPEALEQVSAGDYRWLWHECIANGMLTLFTSRWKAGKTTLLSILLQRFTRGGTLAGHPVATGRAVIVSEEPAQLWRRRHALLDFGPDLRICCRPFLGRPTFEQWHDFIQQLVQDRYDLVVIDPLTMFLPGMVENTAALLVDALEPLHRLTDTGTAVVLVHHPRKSASEEVCPRGTGALTSFADILIELDRPANAASERCRRLRVASRLAAPSVRTLELTLDGRDYVDVPTTPDAEGFEAGWPVLKIVLQDSDNRPTRRALLRSWPQDYPKPSESTLVRWLDRAMQEGLVKRKGCGRRYDPFTYSLPKQRFPFDDLPPLEPLNYDLNKWKK